MICSCTCSFGEVMHLSRLVIFNSWLQAFSWFLNTAVYSVPFVFPFPHFPYDFQTYPHSPHKFFLLPQLPSSFTTIKLHVMPHIQKIPPGSLICSGLHHSRLKGVSLCQVEGETWVQRRVCRHLPFTLCTQSSAYFFTTAQREGREGGYSSASHT